MKRHTRPYGCTYSPECKKTFGSKHDWQRHENTQHFRVELWRCGEERTGGGVCAKVFHRRVSFFDHLRTQHKISDDKTLAEKCDKCRIGRNYSARFWCGFCNKLIDFTKRGYEAWNERFSHIDEHFMGRHGREVVDIVNWIPMTSGPSQVEDDSPEAFRSSRDEEIIDKVDRIEDHEQSLPLSLSKSDENGPSDLDTIATITGGSAKRARSGAESDTRSSKRSKFSENDEVVICVSAPHHPS